MKHSRVNHLKRYINIQKIVADHYVPGVSTYSGIWRMYINPIYPMTYKRFIEIINMSRLHEQLAEELAQKGEQANDVTDNQLELF